MTNSRKTFTEVKEPPLPHLLAVAKLLENAKRISFENDTNLVYEKTVYGYKDEEVLSKKNYDLVLGDGRVVQDLTQEMVHRDVQRKLVEHNEYRKVPSKFYPYSIRIKASKHTLAQIVN